MKKVFFKSAKSVGHFELPDDAVITNGDDIIILNNEDDEEMDEGLYPAGLIMEGDEGNENDLGDRNVKGDNDADDPLDREEGMFPSFVK